MSAPLKNQNAAKPAAARLDAKKEVRGTPAERAAWNRAQARSRQNWNQWSRAALNAAAGLPPPVP